MRLNHNTMVVGLHSALQQENGLRMQLEQTLRLRDADLLQHSQSQSQAASQHLIMSNSLLGQLTASCNREAYSLHATEYYYYYYYYYYCYYYYYYFKAEERAEIDLRRGNTARYESRCCSTGGV